MHGGKSPQDRRNSKSSVSHLNKPCFLYEREYGGSKKSGRPQKNKWLRAGPQISDVLLGFHDSVSWGKCLSCSNRVLHACEVDDSLRYVESRKILRFIYS